MLFAVVACNGCLLDVILFGGIVWWFVGVIFSFEFCSSAHDFIWHAREIKIFCFEEKN